jgi:hypothetical protein
MVSIVHAHLDLDLIDPHLDLMVLEGQDSVSCMVFFFSTMVGKVGCLFDACLKEKTHF